MRPRTVALLFASVVVAGALVAGPPVSAGSKPKIHHEQFVPTGSARQALAKKFTAASKTERAASVVPVVAGLDPKLNVARNSASSTDVNVHGSVQAVSSAVLALGGTVQAAAGGVVAATVPTSKLADLARSSGVASVSRPVKAFTDGSAVTQGVVASGASTWQNTGFTGTGVAVAVVDAGFANLASEIALGNLPANTTVVGNHCEDVNDTDHGTAVAEIVHQMAPGASLSLYCIDNAVGLQASEIQIQAAGIKIVNCSLAFPGDDRGDGTGGGPTSAAATVQTARQSGILWIESAGNSGTDHWAGTFAPDVPATNLTKLDANGNDLDYVTVPRDASAEFFLQWDDWPTSNLNISLATSPSDASGNPIGAFTSQTQTPGSPPTLSVCFAPGGNGCVDSSVFPVAGQLFAIGIQVPATVAPLRFDLDYEGSVSSNSLSCSAPNPSTKTCTAYSPTPGSIAQPASSPFALAVGAADASGSNACGGDLGGTGPFPLESYSSQGPTIDNRIKPDIAAFDGTAGNLGSAFCGTSASAPHVAAAAAIVLQANPSFGADQLQSYLQTNATSSTANPPNNGEGAGVLNLASPPLALYSPLSTPSRVLDTRTSTGGHLGMLAAGQSVNVSVRGAPANVPADATAVAVNITGVTPTSATFLTAYASNVSPPLTSNLNVAPAGDDVAAVFAIVRVSPDGSISILNGTPNYTGSGNVHVVIDVVGYFSPSASGAYLPWGPIRAVDTRTGLGGQTSQMTAGETLKVNPNLPTGATAALVNVTSAGSKGSGVFTLSPDGSNNSSTLNYIGVDRANLAIVKLSAGSADRGDFYVHTTGASSDLIIDVVAYFAPSASSGAGYLSLASPVRILDTRTGTGGRSTPFGPGTTMALSEAGTYFVPSQAVAVMVGAIGIAPTLSTFLQFYPGSPRPTTSNLNFSPGHVVANAVVANLSSGATNLFNAAGTTNVVVDLFGYFTPIHRP